MTKKSCAITSLLRRLPFNEVLSEKDIPMRFAQLRLEADLKRAKSSLLDKN
jgi:hypothetical protein